MILAVQLYSYFKHIHPLPNGNGRLGRCLMHDYHVLQGYLPIIFADLKRQNHLAMVNEAHSGNQTNLCVHLIETQMEMQFELSLLDRRISASLPFLYSAALARKISSRTGLS